MKRVLTWIGRSALALFVVIAVLAIAGLIYQAVAEANDARSYPPPGELVDVGGYRLHLHCTGANTPGSPTVILDTLAGGSMVNWAWVQPEIAKVTRVCSYDRAGFGWSDSSPNPHNLQRAATDLHTLLTRARVTGPYVLVGHSLGGLIVRQFAAEHPSDVAGVVMLDAAHPDQFMRHPEYLNEAESMMPLIRLTPSLARLGLMRLYASSGDAFDFGDLPPRQRAELTAAWSASKHWDSQLVSLSTIQSFFEEAQGLGNLGDVPLAVITASENEANGWDALQAELAMLSTNSVHRTVSGATHASLAFNSQHAQATSAAILDVVKAAWTGQPLAK